MTRPTIHDVAERAGVSKSLVSLVLRDSRKVTDAKRAAVLKAIEDLGYRPHAGARILAAARTELIGVMVSDLHNPFFAEVIDGIDAAAGTSGYRTLITTGNRVVDQEAQAVDTLLELRADGLLILSPLLDTVRMRQASRSAPMVMVGRATRVGTIDSVRNDDRAGAELAVDHLARLGHRRIACIDGGRGAGADDRRRGYRNAMERLALGDLIRVAPGAYTESGGYRAARRLLEEPDPPTAICAANDLAAIGALHAVEEAGFRVPDDLSLVGYDNTALAALHHISLTTIDQPRREMGETAVEVLRQRIEEDRRSPERVVLAPSLVVRGTTAPPP